MTQTETRNTPPAPDTPASQADAAIAAHANVDELLAALSLWEKCSLLAGRDGNWTVPIPRLGLDAVGMTDGPHGVCAWADCNSYKDRPAATTFPCGAALASTWNPELIWEVDRTLGQETRTLGYEVLLGPCINIVRSPLGGRNFETYGEGLRVGYRHYDAAGLDVLFPFGHGLSYTSFEYGAVTAPQTGRIGETVSISLPVTNTGSRAGFEVVQVYVADRECSHWRPEKELKRFAKIWLEPGETRTVSFELDERCFAFWNLDAHRWQVEAGAFEILVGASSRSIRCRATVELKE